MALAPRQAGGLGNLGLGLAVAPAVNFLGNEFFERYKEFKNYWNKQEQEIRAHADSIEKKTRMPGVSSSNGYTRRSYPKTGVKKSAIVSRSTSFARPSSRRRRRFYKRRNRYYRTPIKRIRGISSSRLFPRSCLVRMRTIVPLSYKTITSGTKGNFRDFVINVPLDTNWSNKPNHWDMFDGLYRKYCVWGCKIHFKAWCHLTTYNEDYFHSFEAYDGSEAEDPFTPGTDDYTRAISRKKVRVVRELGHGYYADGTYGGTRPNVTKMSHAMSCKRINRDNADYGQNDIFWGLTTLGGGPTDPSHELRWRWGIGTMTDDNLATSRTWHYEMYVTWIIQWKEKNPDLVESLA